MPVSPFARSVHPMALAILVIAGFLVRPADDAQAQKSLLRESYDASATMRIEVESVFGGPASRGFMPVRVKLRNIRKQDRTWTLRFNFGGGWNQTAYDSTFQVSADAGTEPVHELMVPVPMSIHGGSSMYHSLNIQVTSPGLKNASGSDSGYYNVNWPSIGLSKKLAERNTNRLNDAAQKRSGSHGSEAFGARFDPEGLPADWRGYTSLDVLMMTEPEWRATSPGARLAIIEWVRLGGRLDLYTTDDPGSVLWSLDLPGEPVLAAKEHALSLGKVFAWKWNGQDLEPAMAINRYRNVRNRGGFLSEDYDHKTDWGLYEKFGEKSFNPWLVILLLIAFGIVVGPINLFVWAKPGRRHRLFLTTPAISLVASGLILVLILFNDGIGGSGLRIILANLQSEPQEKRLYVIQEQVSRTGVLLGSGFEVEDPVYLSPVMIPTSQWNRIGQSNSTVAKFSLNGRTYRGDWFQSRSEQGQFAQVVRPTRSRIELTAPAAGDDPASPPKLFSSLEFTFDDFFYIGESGKVWKSKSGEISGGEEIALATSTEEELRDWWNGHLKGMSSGIRQQAMDIWERPGHFFAISTDPRAGFVDTLGSIKWKDQKAMVFGTVLAAGSQAAPAAGESESPESESADE